MKTFLSLAVAVAVIAGTGPALAGPCHMEKQCQWKDGKKVCMMVRVCR